MKEQLGAKFSTLVEIFNDKGECLVSKENAIQPANMAIAIARALSRSPNHYIHKIKLGNGGTSYDNGQIVFKPPRTTDNTLYNATYAEIIDESDSAVGADNSVTMTIDPGSTTARVIATVVITPNEAVDIRPTDIIDPTDPNAPQSIDPEGKYFFDELGLFTKQTSGDILDGAAGDLMLTHLIFSPIEHTASRELTIVYSLLISVA